MSIEFTIPGRAVPKGRPRMTKSGKVYTPAETQKYEYKVMDCFMTAYPNFEKFTQPLWVRICESRAMPTSWSAKMKQRMWGEPCGTRPDLDNVMKSVLDGLNGIAFRDDNQIASLHGEKRWDYDNSVTVIIQPIDEEGRNYE